jgi:glycosyltransferase involved in cell wall biosynthesis
LKVALVVPGGFGGPDDVIPALSSLVDELARSHDVHVFEFSSPGVRGHSKRGRADIHLLSLPPVETVPRVARRAFVLSRLGRQLAREVLRAGSPIPFDVLHAFWANDPGFLCGLLGRVLRVRVVLSVGGGESVWMPEIGYGGAGSFPQRVKVWSALRLADEVTVGTTFARSFLDRRTASSVSVIPLGVPWRHFYSEPERPLGPPWRLLHVGHMNRVKDHDTLLHAFVGVLGRLRDVSIDCIGLDDLGGRVQGQAQMLGLSDHVRFHGFLPPQLILPLYRSAHLHVLSSRYESQAVVVLEAAAAGVPTVGTAVGILPTLSPSAATCVEPGDAQGLARAICELLEDEPRRRAMGALAQEFARAHDVAWTARAFEGVYFADGRRAFRTPSSPSRR